jgi:hypothetical protein
LALKVDQLERRVSDHDEILIELVRKIRRLIEASKPIDKSQSMLKFPSMEAVLSFANDPAYAKYRRACQAGSISRFHVIDDTDVAGTIPYLPKG